MDDVSSSSHSPREMGDTPAPANDDTISLVTRAQDGDNLALERLCARYLPRLYRWAMGRLPSSVRGALETGDLVQETLIGTVRQLNQLHPQRPGSFPAYLRMALLNRIRDEVRKVGRKPVVGKLVGNEATASPSPLEQTIGLDLQEQYENALMQLKEDDRSAVFLRIELGLPYEEIASALGKPSPDAARMTVRRALVRLAEEMSDEN